MTVEADARRLTLTNRHTGERLHLRRLRRDGVVLLEIHGSLPPGREGPPLHVHLAEDEEGVVVSGTLTTLIAGRRAEYGPGDEATIPRGAVHRWWNEGSEELVFRGVARPAIDLDRFLQAIFEIVNAGEPGRPPLVYLAHALLRHRHTQVVVGPPRWLQTPLFALIVVAGALFGRYRGVDWPGCPARCAGAPLVDEPSS